MIFLGCSEDVPVIESEEEVSIPSSFEAQIDNITHLFLLDECKINDENVVGVTLTIQDTVYNILELSSSAISEDNQIRMQVGLNFFYPNNSSPNDVLLNPIENNRFVLFFVRIPAVGKQFISGRRRFNDDFTSFFNDYNENFEFNVVVDLISDSVCNEDNLLRITGDFQGALIDINDENNSRQIKVNSFEWFLIQEN